MNKCYRRKLTSCPRITTNYRTSQRKTDLEKGLRRFSRSLTFCENQSGGRPGSEKGLMALLTDTLKNTEVLRLNKNVNRIMKVNKYGD